MASIFSTYSQGENRVTASFLAVLRSLSLDRMQRLTGMLLEEDDFELIRFENQPSSGATGVPDAQIHSNVRILIETKLKPNTVNLPQIKRHLERLKGPQGATERLLVLTPDERKPEILDALNDDRIGWRSFTDLDEAINKILSAKNDVISEREQFLLRQLQEMLLAEELIGTTDNVLVVAARNAWPEYKHFHAYVCQPRRTFQKVDRIAFYTKNQVFPLIPKIISVHDDVDIISGKYHGALGTLVDHLIKEDLREAETRNKIFLLTAPDSVDTLKLSGPIPNAKTSKSGKPTAFTMGHTYVDLEKLLHAKSTLDLE